MYGTIERMGTGTEEMTKQCLEKGLGKPEFISNYVFQTIIKRQHKQDTSNEIEVTAPVTAPVEELITTIGNDAFKRVEIMEKLQLSHKQSFCKIIFNLH